MTGGPPVATGRSPAATEAGFAAPIVLATMVVVGLLALALADVGNVLVAAQRARHAADAAALAAAAAQWPYLSGSADPEGSARASAEDNGAYLVSCECPVRGTLARVEVGVATSVRLLRTSPSVVRARATASADVGVVFRPPEANASPPIGLGASRESKGAALSARRERG